jgi:hypothetical protein
MISGAHMIIYSTDAKADQAYFVDVLSFPSVDAGQAWLIFALPPGLVQRSALLLEGLEVCIFTTSGTCVAFFQATLQFPSHSGLDLAPGPDRAWENVLPGK